MVSFGGGVIFVRNPLSGKDYNPSKLDVASSK